MRDFFIRNKSRVILLLVIAVIGMIFLAALVFFYPVFHIDISFSKSLQIYRSQSLDFVMLTISFFGKPLIVTIEILAFALFFYAFQYKREALFVLITSLASFINFGLKAVFNRPRPTEDIVDIIGAASNESFPSGHVVHYVVFFGFLFFAMDTSSKIAPGLRLSIKFIAVILILTVPVSRIYLGLHWLTDVVAGYLVGIILLSILLYFYYKKPGSIT